MIDTSTLERLRASDPPSRLMLQDGCVAKLVGKKHSRRLSKPDGGSSGSLSSSSFEVVFGTESRADDPRSRQ
jgi:hypothetical protein